MEIDQEETALLWREALARAADRPRLEEALFKEMLREARPRPLLRQLCIGIAARRGGLAGLLIQGWPVEILKEEEEDISSALQQLGDGGLLKSFKGLIISESQNQGESP